jgi:uncharacterized protein YndB with AHSA1/START domain
MDHQLEISKTIAIGASANETWKALTDRETIKKYFFGTEAISDWKPGSKLVFRGEYDDRAYEDKGTVLEAEPGKLLKYSYWSGFSGLDDIPENYSVVTYALEQSGRETILHLSQKGFANEEARVHSGQGWAMVLNNLKELLESR